MRDSTPPLAALSIALILLLLLFVYLDGTEADGTRPRYTLIDVRFSFLFANSDTLPFTLIRQMCWNSTEGFCDEGLDGMQESYFLIDWEHEAYGAVFETDSGGCFWWMYRPEFGEDGNPHVAEHYWIECPVIVLN